MLIVLATTGCHGPSGPAKGSDPTSDLPWPPALLDDPQVVQTGPLAPYARRVSLRFDREVTLEGAATDGDHTIPIEVLEPSAEPSFPLIGLYADRTWTVELEAIEAGGGRLALPAFSFTTAPLPDGFPVVDLLADEPGSEPGFTLVPFVEPEHGGWLVVLDARGEVAWLWDGVGKKVLEALVRPDGVLFMHGEDALLEVDWEGVLRRRLHVEGASEGGGLPVPYLPLFHHELMALDDGSWLTLTRQAIEVPSYPRSYDDPTLRTPATVGQDRIVTLDPDTGEILAVWSLGEEVLDLGRIGHLSLSDTALGFDWTHSNAVSIDAERDLWVASIRHQDAVLGIDRATGELRWVLANPDNWVEPWASLRLRPVGDVQWPWHQHAPKWLGDGRLLLFDNGNFGVSPWTGLEPLEPYEVHSRVVMYRVDPEAGTVEQEWTFEPEPWVYSQAMGDVDLLPGGTVLANFAHVDRIGGIATADLGRGDVSFMVLEFEPESGRIVWGVDVWAPSVSLLPDWRSYRAERFPSFGPGGVQP